MLDVFDPVFFIQTLSAYAVLGLLAMWFIEPWLSRRAQREALLVLLIPHTFRYVGFTVLADGVVDPALPDAFAQSVAWGDIAAMALALVAIAAVRGEWSQATTLVWVFNVVGAVDLLLAYGQGVRLDVLPLLGPYWYVPTMVVPVLLVGHVLIFRQLLNRRRAALSGG